MDYVYSTHVTVPESIVNRICTDLLRNTLHECSGDDMYLTDLQLFLLGRKMNKIMDSMCQANRVSVDGWHLDDEHVREIASELHNHRKVGAIRAFREATGAGLKDAKHFIDSFCTGQHREAGPLAAISFQSTFLK